MASRRPGHHVTSVDATSRPFLSLSFDISEPQFACDKPEIAIADGFIPQGCHSWSTVWENTYEL